MKDLIESLFLSERGEVGDETVADDTTLAPETDEGTVDVAEESTTTDNPEQQSDATTQAQRDDFLATEENLDPRKLDPALQPIFKRMQGVYTKRMQDIAEIRDKAATVDKFYTDPNFAQQTILQWATQNGYQITPVNGQRPAQQGQQAQQGDAPPAYLVEAFKQKLAPELQWMAEPQAAAMWSAMQGMLQPVLEQNQVRGRQEREGEWNKHAQSLSEVAPGWEEHEDAMGELFDFLKSDNLHHPTYGSKIQMLYDLATARSASLKQAQQRVANAGKNRVSSSRPTGNRANSVEDDILKAKPQDAWELAKKHALSQHKPR